MIELGRYRHFKGNIYNVINVAVHSETLENMVVYVDVMDNNKCWVRPLAMFDDCVKDNNEFVKRFVKLED